MQMDAGLDTGPTLLTKQQPIGPVMNSGELHDALATLGAAALLETLPLLESGTALAMPQPVHGITYAAKLDKREARVDWTRDAAEISRQVRAFNPWPIAETRFAGEQLRLHRALAENGAGDAAAAGSMSMGAAPGKILGLRADGALRVACGDGVLAIASLQRQGRRVMSAREFANGCDVIGAQLG